MAAIRAIQEDPSLTDEEKAKKRQELVCGSSKPLAAPENGKPAKDLFDGRLNCSFCMQLPERPVTVRLLFLFYFLFCLLRFFFAEILFNFLKLILGIFVFFLVADAMWSQFLLEVLPEVDWTG